MIKFLKFIFGSLIGGVIGAFLGVMILVGGLLSFAYIANESGSPSDELQAVPDRSVLVLDLSQGLGEFSPDSFIGAFSFYNVHDLKEVLRQAQEDSKIKSLLIKTNPYFELGWSTAKDLREMIQSFSDSGKKVYAYGEMFDEKNLYVLTAADKIFMHPTGEISWNGIASVPMFYKNLFEKVKAKPLVFKAGKFKSAVERYQSDKMSPESRQQTSELITNIWEDGLAEIATSRNLDAVELEAFAETYAIRTAQTAKKMGLIDGVVKYTDLVERLIIDKEDKKEADETEEQAKKLILTKEDLKRLLPISSYVSLSHSGLFGAMNSSVFVKNVKSKTKIAVLVLEGTIMPGPSSPETIGSDTVVMQLQKLRHDKEVKGVVLRVNSPGGSALASDVIWAELEKLKSVKPFFVSMGDVAASGGYYISAGADKIFARSNTVTGSIGVFSVLFNIKETLNDKVGLTFDRVVTNPFADIGSGVRDMVEEEKDIFNKDVVRIYKKFLKVVAKGRSFNSTEDVDLVAQGRVWSGNQAKEATLIDEIGGLDDAVTGLAAELKLENYDVDYYPKKSPIEGLILSLEKFGFQANHLSNLINRPAETTQKELLKLRSSLQGVQMLMPQELNLK